MWNIKAGWICFLGGLFVLYQFLLQGSISLMVPELQTTFCSNATQIGFLSSAFFYPYILLQIPSGAIIDKLGPKRTIIIGLACLILASFIFSNAQSISTANAARILMGIGSAPAVACAMYLSIRWFPKHFAILAGLIEMIGMLGGAIGDYLLDYMTQHYSWQYAIHTCTLFGLMLFLFSLIWIKDRNYTDTDTDTDISKQASHHHTQAPVPLQLMHRFKILMQYEIWLNCLYGAFIFSIISAFASLWAIPFLQAYYPDHALEVSKAVALTFIGTGLGSLLSGYISTKFLSHQNTMRIFAIVCASTFLTMVYIPTSFHMMQCLLFILGLSAGSYILPFCAVERLVPDCSKGIAMGFTNMIIILIGGPIFQPLIGTLLNHNIFQHDVCNVLHNIHSHSKADYVWAFLPITAGLILTIFLSFMLRNKNTTSS